MLLVTKFRATVATDNLLQQNIEIQLTFEARRITRQVIPLAIRCYYRKSLAVMGTVIWHATVWMLGDSRSIGFWISENPRGELKMTFALITTYAVLAFTCYMVGADLWYTRNEFDNAAYAACNTMTVAVVFIKLIIYSYKREKLFNLIEFCYKNFWHADYDSFGEIILRDCETRCIYCICTFTSIALCVVFSYMLQPIVGNIGRNGTDRMLLFTMWVDLPLTTTPYYEMTFFTQLMGTYYAGMLYFGFDNLLCMINVHVGGQFRILQRRFELLCLVRRVDDCSNRWEARRKDSLIGECNQLSLSLPTPPNPHYTELKACIRHHQSLIGFVKMVEDVYTFVALSQVVIFSVLLCLTTYQAALAGGSTILRRFIFVTHSCGTLNQIFMFTLTCDEVTQQSRDIVDAVYNAKWYYRHSNHEDRRLCKNLMIVMMRANRPCSLTAGGFAPVSLETFTAIISASMSYLTMLRRGGE